MLDFFSALVTEWDYFLLLFIRVLGLVVNSPIFGRRQIPNIAKVCYCVCLAGIFYIAAANTQPLDYNDDLLIFILLCIKEFLVGMVLSYVLNIFFTLIPYTAGQMIDMQLGFMMANVLDPQTQTNIPITANVLSISMLLSFFSVNGHLKVVQMLFSSVESIPVGSVEFTAETGWMAVALFVDAFLIVFMIFLPIYAAAMLEEVCFGVLNRLVPQVNAFVINMPIKSILGFAILIAMMPVYINFCNDIFDDLYIGINNMFATLAG